jgi:BlaI family transcriptional regulator, penicillinase repressor
MTATSSFLRYDLIHRRGTMVIKNIAVTELELLILQQIWEQGDEAPVNLILENWPQTKRPGYTTILKTLQKMEKKGIVGHRPEGKKYLYFPKVSKAMVTQKRLDAIIDRVFSGSKLAFAEYFVNSNSFSQGELDELKRLIAARKNKEEEK